MELSRDALEARFEGDSECRGNHAWLFVAPPGVAVAEIYHLNGDNGDVLPPTPRVATQPQPR